MVRKISLLIFTVIAAFLLAIYKERLPINTPYADLAPTVSGDGSIMFFESDREGSLGGYDIWFTKFIEGKGWSEPKNIRILNSKYFDGLPSISIDGKTLFISSYRDGFIGKKRNLDIYVSFFRNGKWTKPKNLGYPINSPYYDGTPSISYDEKYLFFASNRPGGVGGIDIWVSKKLPNGLWSKPVNLGEPINSSADELSPYIQPDGRVLYFSSNRSGGEGGFDIYKSEFKNGKWQSPVNLSDKVNTSLDETYFTFPLSGSVIYISSGESGKEDIYKLILPKEYRPNPVLLVKGFVKDKDTRKKLDATIYLYKNDKIFKVVKSSKESGFFLVIPGYGKYTMRISKEGYMELLKEYDTSKLKNFYEENKYFYVKKKEEIGGIDVYFEYGKATLTDESKLKLYALLSFLKSHPRLKILIVGYTDSYGSEIFNFQLGLKRAESVKRFLVKHGVSESRIKILSGGESFFFFPNTDEENRFYNRRCEIILYY